jgi:hypothetical protein
MLMVPRCLCLGVIALIVVACSSKSPGPAAPSGGTSAQTEPSAPASVAPTETARPAAPPAAIAEAPSKSPPVTSEASCPAKPLPKGCPVTAPNVNHPCSSKGIECTYVPGCCPSPVYVCNKKGRFEARFTRC